MVFAGRTLSQQAEGSEQQAENSKQLAERKAHSAT